VCVELGMHLCFGFVRVSSTLLGQVGYISVLLTHGQSSACSVLCSCGQPREIPVLLPFALRPTNSLWGLPLWRRRPHHPVGFRPWPLPGRVKPGPTVGGSYRGPLPFNCLPLAWGQLRMKCPPLPQPQHILGRRLSATFVGDPRGLSTVDCWRRCLISASSSQTKLVVKLIGSLAAAVATCTAVFAGDVDTSSSVSTYCTVVPGRHVLSAWK